MRICIFGAGAVGGHFAVRLALSGHDVSCVMRGPHLEAVKAKGLTLRVGDAKFTAKVNASDDPATLGLHARRAGSGQCDNECQQHQRVPRRFIASSKVPTISGGSMRCVGLP